MLLSRIILKGTSKHFLRNPNFVKEFSSYGYVALKSVRPPEYLKRTKCVTINESVRRCSSLVSQKPGQNSDGKASDPEIELEVDMYALTGGDPMLEKRVKILSLEKDILMQEGYKVPTHMNTNQWKEFINLPTRSKRVKYLSYLFGVEKKKENRKIKKEEKRSLAKSEKTDSDSLDESDHITYGFRGSTIFLRVYDTTMNNFYNSNVIRAMMFGQKLVFDCSYDPYMTPRESKNCAKQLMIAFSENRIYSDPFNVYLTGGKPDCPTLSNLHNLIPIMYDDTFPLTITEQSYLELFPREKLVYLTPHCREELLEYDHDAVYIVGSMVDKVNNEPLSLAKAKREGLKMAKLPLDRYLDWGSGSGKSLTLNQMVKILLEQKDTGDWRKSLIHVPQRKLVKTAPVVKPFNRRFRPEKIDIKSLMS